jgi:PAS domain S-box-containing protein
LKGKGHAQELAGVPVAQVLPSDEATRLDQTRKVLDAALANRIVEIHEALPDGSMTYRVVTPTPIVESGRMVQLWGITTDITALKQAEMAMRESERQYHVVFDNAPSGLLLLRDGQIVELNRKSEQLFGRSSSEIMALGFAELSPAFQPDGSDSRQLMLAEIERASGGVPLSYEWQFLRADGVPFDADVGLNPVDLAGGAHLLAVVRDITARKQREVELRELKAQLERENLQLREVIHVEQEAPSLVGQSDAMRRVFDDVRTVAPTGAAVLIVGETGVGKELVARAVHQQSLLADKPLVTVNCAALASGLIESEFFGHERGAFTGAVSRKIGRFELADGGTIFLDEVGDLPLDLQAKLLRVLQNGEFERVGGTQTLKVNVRVISATNRNLQEAVRTESFRADLYYRLSVFPVEVPALRNRRGDIPLLVQHSLNGLSRSLGKPLTSVTPTSLDALMAHDWPGNVRELLHVLERAAIRTRGTVVEIEDIGVGAAVPREKAPSSAKLQDVERTHILEVLRDSRWVIEGPRGAAAKVGLHPNTLRSRMKKLGIERP